MVVAAGIVNSEFGIRNSELRVASAHIVVVAGAVGIAVPACIVVKTAVRLEPVGQAEVVGTVDSTVVVAVRIAAARIAVDILVASARIAVVVAAVGIAAEARTVVAEARTVVAAVRIAAVVRGNSALFPHAAG